MSNNTCVIIAGASGLVGSNVITQLVSQPGIHTLYSLSRRPLTDISDPEQKIVPMIDADLSILNWDEQHLTPEIGFICLGTTLKQAQCRACCSCMVWEWRNCSGCCGWE